MAHGLTWWAPWWECWAPWTQPVACQSFPSHKNMLSWWQASLNIAYLFFHSRELLSKLKRPNIVLIGSAVCDICGHQICQRLVCWWSASFGKHNRIGLEYGGYSHRCGYIATNCQQLSDICITNVFIAYCCKCGCVNTDIDGLLYHSFNTANPTLL